MNISIIIINFNMANEVLACLQSLAKNCKGDDFEIILFENGSTTNSIEKHFQTFKSLFTSIKFISSDENLGFGRACNQAAKSASGKILFFLNPDTIVENDIISEIKNSVLSSISNDFIAGLKVNSNFYLDFSAGYFPNLFFETLNIFLVGRYFEAFFIKLKSLTSKRNNIEVDWTMGSALLISKVLFEKLGGFDSKYFLYFEEMDLCKKAKIYGYNVFYFPKLRINHLGSIGSKRNYYFFTKMFYKGKMIFLKKHNSELKFKLYTLIMRLQFFSQILFWSILSFKKKSISIDKIKAFKELLKYLNCPENISNNLSYS